MLATDITLNGRVVRQGDADLTLSYTVEPIDGPLTHVTTLSAVRNIAATGFRRSHWSFGSGVYLTVPPSTGEAAELYGHCGTTTDPAVITVCEARVHRPLTATFGPGDLDDVNHAGELLWEALGVTDGDQVVGALRDAGYDSLLVRDDHHLRFRGAVGGDQLLVFDPAQVTITHLFAFDDLDAVADLELFDAPGVIAELPV